MPTIQTKAAARHVNFRAAAMALPGGLGLRDGTR